MKQAAGILSVIIMVGAAFFVLFGKQPTKEQPSDKDTIPTITTTETAATHSEATSTTTTSDSTNATTETTVASSNGN